MDTRLVGRVIDAARTVSALLPVSATALDLKQAPPNGSVRAQVAARLADGTFRVLIDGKALKLALPDDVKTGDILQLRVVGREGDAPPSHAYGTSAAGKGLSSAGQLVADLVKQPSTTPPRQAQPVVSAPPDTPETLAAPLARAVERSGVFYESHQARWVNGEFPLERLLEEPQAQAGKPQAASPPASASPPPGEHEPPVTVPPSIGSEADELPEDARQVLPQTGRDAEREAADKGKDLVARETLPVVRQQLETLETRHFNWLGELWPGQSMRWQIGEGPHDEDRGACAEHEWDSRFTLDLPSLGNVGAELALVDNRLRVRLSAADETTATMMRDSSRELSAALQAAGVEPLSLEVQHREPPF